MATVVKQMLEKVKEDAELALERGIQPLRLSIASETFLLFDFKGSPLAIFKPDASREALCFLLDHEHFAGVPATFYTTLKHPKWRGERKGSLQLYVQGSGLDPATLPSADIRRIAQLDIRLTNPDRHRHNFLFSKGKLIPIDHARALPEKEQNCYFAWMEFEGAKTPFTPEEIDYISGLDPMKYKPLFAEFGMNSDSFKIYLSATRTLQEGVKCGLTPYEIGNNLEKGSFG